MLQFEGHIGVVFKFSRVATDAVLGPFATAKAHRIFRGLAGRIGKPDAVRAVGLANGRNPIPIVVPCHRVIGTDRSLTGFGLGVPVKAWLLVHEHAAEPFPAGVTAATRVVAPASLW